MGPRVMGTRRGMTARWNQNVVLRPSDIALGGVWVVDDFPKMSIRVAEVTGVDAPGSVVNFGYWCSRCLGFGKQRVHLLPSCYYMAETELTAPRRPGRDARVFGEFRARVEGEDLPTREVEHDDCTCRVRVVAAMLGCYDAGRLKAECSVEGECPVEVGHGQGDYIDARIHRSSTIVECSAIIPETFLTRVSGRWFLGTSA